jgi:Cu+-exporting ATPase
VNDLRLAGRSTVFVAVDGICAGLLAISDPIKESTPEALRALKQLGLKIVMLTGDNRETACAISSGLPIDHVEFELSPGDKLDRINHWKSDGQLVAMAGDGINDAPALAAADVGIAMGSGTDVAIESAGVTLVGGDLRGLVKSIQLSRLTMRNIRQNLFFAFFYNLLGIPVAAGALYPISADLLLNPMVAAAAMSCSSLSIITNALRLRTLKLDRDTRSVAS